MKERISRLSICHLATIISKYIQSIENFLVLNGPLKMGLQNIFYYSVLYVLLFGLSSACYVFTKVLRPLTKRWRGIGIKAIIYIDGGIAASRSFELAKTAGELVKNDLVSAGLVINVKKSDFNPKTKGKWLGTITDTIKMTFTVPSEKINKLLTDIIPKQV